MAGQKQRNTTQRLSSSPAWNTLGNIYELPANAVGGTAESLLGALRTVAAAKSNDLKEGNISGILLSTKGGGMADCFLRTADTGTGAADAGTGIHVVKDTTLYIPFPHFMATDLLYECAVEVYVAVFY